MSATTFPPVLAVPPGTRPALVCPPWCVVDYDKHIAELGELEGRVIHWSAEKHSIVHSVETYPDGTVSDPAEIHIEGQQEMSIEEAEQFARALLASVEEARS